MYTFECYRPAPTDGKHTPEQKNAPDEVQYEGVVFSDGCCVIRWMTALQSVSVWENFETMMRVHGHPEYGTYYIWDDGIAPPWFGDLWEKFKEDLTRWEMENEF